MLKKILFVVLTLQFLCVSAVRAQECAPPKIVANANSTNFFSPEQEMILGELTLSNLSGDVRLVKNSELLLYVNAIGERLVKHLPPTGLRYTFHIMDIPEANAFNIPGGHVFLSRKLIAFVNNEDELAGVMAHELGHAVVRHGASDLSDAMRKILKINSIGDRKDITEKYNLLIENARTKRISRKGGHENEQQLEADKIGLYAMVAAGYDAAAFTSFFDRLTETEGKTGSWFSDLFGNTRPEQKRLREMIRAADTLPPTCRENRSAQATENFLKWQADVVSFRDKSRKEELPGFLWKRELAPKLRSDISHFAFSPDGKFLLAQDDFAVTVIQRQPLQTLFQIPIEDARDAMFTPDGTQIVFTTESLRFERWSVAERKPLEIRELVIRSDCWEHELSPNGNFLACVDQRTNINLLDTKTGKKIWEKKEFYPLTGFEYFFWLTSASRSDDEYDKTNFFRIEFSPDSKFVMFSRSNRFRFRIKFDAETVAASENTALALDTTTLKPVDIGGDLKKITSRPYIFLDSKRILGMPSLKPEENGIVEFPSGKRLQKFIFAARQIKHTANPDYVVIKPLGEAKMGIFDVKNQRIATGLNKADSTMFGNLSVYEAASGKILLREVQYNETEKKFDAKEVETLEIPVGSINNLGVASISVNFNWLLLSSKSRGGLWNLSNGERKVFVRGFKGGIIADDGVSVGEFPKLDDTPHSLVFMNPTTNQVAPIREMPGKGSRQYGRFLLVRKSLKEEEKKKTDREKAAAADSDDDDAKDLNLEQEVRFEVFDFIKQSVVWSRDFPKDAPRYSFDEYSGRLIFYWRLGSETGKAKLKEMPELQAKAAALGNKQSDYLIEVIDAFAAKPVGAMLLETGKGSFFVGSGQSEGDWLVLKDSEGRVLVYSIKTGELRHRFFGNKAAMNPARNQIAVENFPGEVGIYNLETGDLQASYVINGGAAFVRFSLAGDKIFVLSDSQTAYVFDLNKSTAPKKL
jgi:WD40 repeat protein